MREWEDEKEIRKEGRRAKWRYEEKKGRDK